MILDQSLTETLKIWGLPTVGTRPAGGLPPLDALKYNRCANMQGAAPCRLLADRGEGSSPRGIPGGCQTLLLTSADKQLQLMWWLAPICHK